MPLVPLAETFPVFVLAFLNKFTEFWGLAVILENLAVVEPMLYVVAVRYYSGMVPLADGLWSFKTVVGFDEVIEA